MSKVIAFKSKQNLIDEKQEQIERELDDMDAAIAEWTSLANSGTKLTLEQTKEMWSKITRPGKSMKELNRLTTGEEGKDPLELALESMDGYSDAELKSGLLTAEHLEEYENSIEDEETIRIAMGK